MISSNKLTKVCEEIKMETELQSSSISKRHTKNTKEITLLFLAINVKTEGLRNQNREDAIMNVKLYIVKQKGV